MQINKSKFVIALQKAWCSLAPADPLILENTEKKNGFKTKTSGHNQNCVNFSTVFWNASMETRAAMFLQPN